MPESTQTTFEGTSERAGQYFLRLTVSGVRTFATEQTLDLSDGKGNPARWTILLGDNGVGKTSLLQVFGRMRWKKSGFEQTNRRFPVFDWPVFGAKKGFEHLARDPEQAIAVEATVATAQNFKSTESETLSIVETSVSCTISGHDYPFQNLKVFGYGAIRRSGTAQLSEQKSDDTTETLFDENIPLINAEEWLLQADYAATKSQDAKAKERFERIKQILIRVLPDVSDIRIEASGIKTPVVEVLTPYGWVLMRRMSSGYRSVVAWMVDLANRLFELYPESANPLAEPAVVLVDQIDIFLHPKWQRDLVKSLSAIFPGAQFIVTAHSPLIVQGAPDANIAVLRKEGDHVVIDQSLENVRGWRLDQILASDLFENTPTRDEETEKMIRERTRLLSKGNMSDDDLARARELSEKLRDLPVGENDADRRAMQLIREAAGQYQAKG